MSKRRESNKRMGLAERLGHIGVTGLGIFLAVTPVALWIAWTAALVVWIMLAAMGCAVLFALLSDFLDRSERKQCGPEGADGRAILPDEFIEEVHRLFPLTYHHSRLESTRFRRAMKRMSQLIADSKPGDMPR